MVESIFLRDMSAVSGEKEAVITDDQINLLGKAFDLARRA